MSLINVGLRKETDEEIQRTLKVAQVALQELSGSAQEVTRNLATSTEQLTELLLRVTALSDEVTTILTRLRGAA